MVKDWDLIRMVNDHHTCYWSEGDGHSLCTHKASCIFRDDLWELDQMIVDMYKELDYTGGDVVIGNMAVNVEKEVLKKKIRKLEKLRRTGEGL